VYTDEEANLQYNIIYINIIFTPFYIELAGYTPTLLNKSG